MSVIVLNYNTVEHLEACFNSLQQLLYPAEKLELILVDNASTDHSVETMQANFGSVKLVINDQNYGFSKGNNIGVETAGGELVAFLNPDMRVDERWLIEAVKPFLAEQDVAAVGSKILSWDGKTVDFAGGAANFYGYGYQIGWGQAAATDFDRVKPVLFGCGGAMIARRQIFLEAGGFDEDFFAYYEDLDLGWRLWVLGYRVLLAPASITYHVHHGAWKSVDQYKRRVLYERNAFFVMLKNYDEANLNRVLPAALLLLLKRSYLAAGIDEQLFRIGNRPQALAPLPQVGEEERLATRLGHRLQAAWRIFWSKGSGALYARIQAELRSYASSRARLRPPVQMKVNGQLSHEASVPLPALSRLVAGNDIVVLYEKMLAKRQLIQARRRRPDREILPLFERPLDPAELWPEYRQTQLYLARLFGIEQMFEMPEATAAEQL